VRLTALEIRGFRGTAHRRVELSPRGVTVLEGPNEVGKSSLVEALDLVFRYPDSSTDRRVREVQPVGRDVATEIRVEGETGPYRFRYLKRFHRERATELALAAPRPELYAGREAHQRMEQILAETLDTDLWAALRVDQGTGTGAVVLGASRSLLAVLDRAAQGGGGDGDESLFARAETELQRYFTPRQRRETGELKEAREAAAVARERAAALARELAAAEADGERVVELEDQQRQRREELERVQEGLRHDREALARGTALADRAERLQARLAALAAERARWQEVERAVAEEAEARARQAACREALGPLEAAWREARDAALERSRAAALAAARAVAARRREALQERSARLARLERDQAALAAARREIRDLEGRLAMVPVDAAAVAEIEEQERALVVAEGALAAAGGTLTVTAEASLTVFLARAGGEDEISLAAGQSSTAGVTEPLRLRLPGLLEVAVEPGAAMAELLTRAAAARTALGDLLARRGVASPAVAREALAARRELERDLAAARAQEAPLRAEGDPVERVREERERVAALAAEASTGTDGKEETETVTAAEAEAAAAAERELELQAVAEQDRRAAALAEGRERAAHLAAALESAGARRARAWQAVETADGDPALAFHRRREAEDGERATRSELAAVEQDLVRERPETLRERVADGEGEVLRGEAALGELRQELARVRGRLEALGERGPFEPWEEAEAAAVLAATRLAAVAARAAAAQRLHEALGAAREVARRSYRRPLAEKITELGRRVFGPTFAVGLGEDLAVAERELDGLRIPFDQLSAGAREQLSLLARLAAALLVAPQGGGAPLVLDDALEHTDPERLAALREVLTRAGRECQVIVLTCHPERFAGLPEAVRVPLEPA
jgi:DNA repair exonuclease SbcCD ATPase subunit